MRCRSAKLLKNYTSRIMGVFIVYSMTLSVVPVDRSLPALDTHAVSNLSPALQVSFPDMARAFGGSSPAGTNAVAIKPVTGFEHLLTMVGNQKGMEAGQIKKLMIDQGYWPIVEEILGKVKEDENLDWLISHMEEDMILGYYAGTRMGLPDDRLLELAVAGLLHDVGKLKWAPALKNGSGMFTKAMQKDKVQHVADSLGIIREVLGKNKLRPKEEQSWDRILRHIEMHHENDDGSGYKGIVGEEMTLEAKILRVIDSLTAMVGTHPPQNGHRHTLDQAIEEIAQLSGSIYSRQVVHALLYMQKELRAFEAAAHLNQSSSREQREIISDLAYSDPTDPDYAAQHRQLVEQIRDILALYIDLPEIQKEQKEKWEFLIISMMDKFNQPYGRLGGHAFSFSIVSQYSNRQEFIFALARAMGESIYKWHYWDEGNYSKYYEEQREFIGMLAALAVSDHLKWAPYPSIRDVYLHGYSQQQDINWRLLIATALALFRDNQRESSRTLESWLQREYEAKVNATLREDRLRELLVIAEQNGRIWPKARVAAGVLMDEGAKNEKFVTAVNSLGKHRHAEINCVISVFRRLLTERRIAGDTKAFKAGLEELEYLATISTLHDNPAALDLLMQLSRAAGHPFQGKTVSATFQPCEKCVDIFGLLGVKEIQYITEHPDEEFRKRSAAAVRRNPGLTIRQVAMPRQPFYLEPNSHFFDALRDEQLEILDGSIKQKFVDYLMPRYGTKAPSSAQIAEAEKEALAQLKTIFEANKGKSFRELASEVSINFLAKLLQERDSNLVEMAI